MHFIQKISLVLSVSFAGGLNEQYFAIFAVILLVKKMIEMKLLRLLYVIPAILALSLIGCIEDGFTSSPSDQPFFSTDTLDMGIVYTDEPTATHRFVVYNPYHKGLLLSSVSISGKDASLLRLNVDGMSGREFSDVEIRANDSIFVFVSADIPEAGTVEPKLIEASLDFHVNGFVQSVIVKAGGQDILRLRGVTMTEDTELVPGIPYQIKDSLVVAENTTLTLRPGSRLLFHDGARLIVRGTLLSQGTPETPVILTGDRTGNVITDVSFDLMSRQWYGIDFMEESYGNRLEFTDVSNTSYGVTVYGDGKDVDTRRLTMVNSRLRNSGDFVLSAIGASVEAYGCEFSDAASGLVYLLGGNHRFDQCTAANYYLFSAIRNAAWTVVDPYNTGLEEYEDFLPTKALVTNTITYGLGADVSEGDLAGWDVFFNTCLFKSKGDDDDNFISSLWDSDPLYYTVREDYIFDYRLQPESPAIGSADLSLSEYPLEVDFYGVKRTSDLGAYAFVET